MQVLEALSEHRFLELVPRAPDKFLAGLFQPVFPVQVSCNVGLSQLFTVEIAVVLDSVPWVSLCSSPNSQGRECDWLRHDQEPSIYAQKEQAHIMPINFWDPSLREERVEGGPTPRMLIFSEGCEDLLRSGV